MKRSKKLIALLLCLVLTLSTAACGGNSSSEPDNSSSVADTSQTKDSDPEASTTETSEGDDWFAGKDFSEKYTISLASVQIEDGRDYNTGDDWVKSWTERFNVEFEITSLTFENWSERLRIWINSDDMPDWCVWNYVNGEAANYADQGLVKMLPDDWKETYPSLAAAQANVSLSEKAEANFGGTYYLFRPQYANNRPNEKLTNHVSLYLRKDWGDAAGAETKEGMTITEVMDWAAKVKEADPGNLGDSFAPIVSTSGYLAQFVQWNNTYAGVNSLPYYLGDDGQYHWGPADESTLEALKILNQAYKDGLIDPEFYTIQNPDDYGAFHTTGTAAALVETCMISDLEDFDSHMSADLGVNFEDAVQIVTVLGEDGLYHNTPLLNFWGVNIFSPHIDDGKLERILSMLDYSSTDEGQLEIRCGIEGVDWDIDESGEITSYLGEGEDLWDKYALMPVYVNMMVLSDDFQCLNPTYKQSLRDKIKRMHETHDEFSDNKSLPAEPDWNVQLHDSQALNLASMDYGDEYAALIVQDGDIEANWQTWVNEKMPVVEPVLEELNAYLE